MIYRNYDISASTNAGIRTYLARNSAGNIIFRESSVDNLKRTIDASFETRRRNTELAKSTSLKKRKRSLFAPPPEELSEEETTKEPKSVTNSAQQRVTRGPDGKFISKNSLEGQDQTDNKTSFWDRLK